MRWSTCTHRSFQALSNILSQQVLHQLSYISMCTQIAPICTHIRWSALNILHSKNLMHFYIQKDWNNPLKQENTPKINIIAWKNHSYKHIQIHIGREGGWRLWAPTMHSTPKLESTQKFPTLPQSKGGTIDCHHI